MKKLWWTGTTIYIWVMLIRSGWSDFESDLNELTDTIVAEYFRMFKCVTYITDRVDAWNYSRRTQIFLVRINEVLPNKALLTQSYEQGCGGYVIRVGVGMRVSLVKHLKSAKEDAMSYRYNKQRYLFLPTGEQDLDLDLLSHPIMYYFPNLLMLTSTKQSPEFSILTHTNFNYYLQNTLNLSHEVLDTWSSSHGFQRKVDLYPNKIKNVRGKNLRYGLIHYIPYTVILKHKNGMLYDGIETRIANIFVKIINGTWDAIDLGQEFWGDFFPNGSANGILGSVQRHDSDFGFAAVYQFNCEKLDCSYPYIQPGVTCLVPKPELISGWYTILTPFELSTWLALFVAYQLISIFVFLLTRAVNKIRGIQNPKLLSMAFESFYNVFRLQLEQIPNIAQQDTPVAVYIRISTLYYYFVAAFWQGIIATVLMRPQHEQPIDSALDMVNRYPQLKWGANHDVWILAINEATDPILRTIIDHYVILSMEELEKRPLQRDFAFFMERLPHGHFGFSSYINKENMHYLRMMRQDVYTGNVVTVMPRDCPYTEYYDHFISWMFDTGIVHKLENQVSLDIIDNSLQLMIKTSNDNEKYEGIMLALRHLEGPLYIYAFGMIVSTVAFIIERSYYRLSKSKRKRRFRHLLKKTKTVMAWKQND